MVLATTSFSVLAEATAPLFGLTTWSNDLEAAEHRYNLRSIFIDFMTVVSILKVVRQTEVLWLDQCMWQIGGCMWHTSKRCSIGCKFSTVQFTPAMYVAHKTS